MPPRQPRAHTRHRPLAFAGAALVAIALLGCPAADSAGQGATDPAPTPPPLTSIPRARTDAAFVQRHAEINALAERDRIELVFLGDSITQRWESTGRFVWSQRYAERGAANFGINGDRSQHVLWRIENGNFDGVHPRGIVLLIGTNNTHEASDAEIVRGVQTIVDALHARLPTTRILVLGLFPKHQDADAPIRARIAAINAGLALMAVRPGVEFVDLGGAFLEPNGSLSRDVMPDGLHLSARGYTIWADALEPSLAWLLAKD
jgi:lysophospholipase L1-like esterase